MAANPLEAAHEAVQARKEACGMPELAEVIAGNTSAPAQGEYVGMFAGTDLTEEQAFEAAKGSARAIAALLMSGAAGITSALVAAYTEGLLTGIEHGRKLGS